MPAEIELSLETQILIAPDLETLRARLAALVALGGAQDHLPPEISPYVNTCWYTESTRVPSRSSGALFCSAPLPRPAGPQHGPSLYAVLSTRSISTVAGVRWKPSLLGAVVGRPAPHRVTDVPLGQAHGRVAGIVSRNTEQTGHLVLRWTSDDVVAAAAD